MLDSSWFIDKSQIHLIITTFIYWINGTILSKVLSPNSRYITPKIDSIKVAFSWTIVSGFVSSSDEAFDRFNRQENNPHSSQYLARFWFETTSCRFFVRFPVFDKEESHKSWTIAKSKAASPKSAKTSAASPELANSINSSSLNGGFGSI